MEEREEKGRSLAGCCAVWLTLAMIPLAYIGMLGPAARWYDKCPRPMQNALQVIYYPLQWLHENTPLRKPLDWYIELWEP